MVEQVIVNHWVVGSSPTLSATPVGIWVKISVCRTEETSPSLVQGAGKVV
jgi:hypothetical protein